MIHTDPRSPLGTLPAYITARKYMIRDDHKPEGFKQDSARSLLGGDFTVATRVTHISRSSVETDRDD